MNYNFRKCKKSDYEFIYHLKEVSFRWYIEVIYGWEDEIQAEWTHKEMEEHLADMNIIQHNGIDIGLLTFYYDEMGDVYVGMFAILPEYRGKGIGTQILTKMIEENPNVRIYIKTYKENRARFLYEKVGFVKCDETKTHWCMEIK